MKWTNPANAYLPAMTWSPASWWRRLRAARYAEIVVHHESLQNLPRPLAIVISRQCVNQEFATRPLWMRTIDGAYLVIACFWLMAIIWPSGIPIPLWVFYVCIAMSVLVDMIAKRRLRDLIAMR